jgi:hypothetical protein
MEGFAVFHRKIVEWQWYTDSNTFRLFFHLILMANHKDNNWKGIDVKRGQIVTGRKSLSKELGLTEQQIRTSINKLISTNEITIEPTNKFTLVTIVNYDFYQKIEPKVTNKSTNNITNEQPTNNQQITTNNNDNHDNHDTYKEIFDYYKTNCKKLPQATKVTEKRKSLLNARISDYGYDEVIKILDNANSSDFLTTRIDENGKSKSWLDFDWIFNVNNFVKIAEGKYNNKVNKSKPKLNIVQSNIEGVYDPNGTRAK